MNFGYLQRVTTEQIVGLLVVLILVWAGHVGCIVPVLPGAGLSSIAALAHRFYFGAGGAGTWVLTVESVTNSASLEAD